MKRFLCPSHAHHLGIKSRAVQLDSKNCTICRWENRPMTLIDLAVELEDIAASLRFAGEDEYYDPFGFTWSDPLQKVFVEYLGMIHKDYRASFLSRLKDKFKEEP